MGTIWQIQWNDPSVQLVVECGCDERYEVDETSPESTLEDALFCPDGAAASYQILSKAIGTARHHTSSVGRQQVSPAGCCCQHDHCDDH